MSNIIDKIQLSGVTYDLPSGGGNATVELTQAEYDALVSAGTVSTNTYYIITDATGGDLSNYYTKTETNAALSRKQDTLSAGTGIDITDSVISATGGGGTIDPSLDSGSTNAVANSAITNAINAKADAIGLDMAGSPMISINFRAKSGGNNGTTLNSVNLNLGKGLVYGAEGFTTLSTSGLVETSAITSSITSSSTDDEIPSAKAVNDKLGGLSLVKLTQTEYDNLSTKDSNTLYVIVN